VRNAGDGHPSSFDAELLTCELVTNAVQHAADAGWVTVAVMRRGAVVHVDVIDNGRSGLPHWRSATGAGAKRPDRSGYRGRDLGRR
jgi:anti-sigma regulatory factor (Ser/Thr protein kinase)